MTPPPAGGPSHCDHGVTFDEGAAESLLSGWTPKDAADFVMGNPMSSQIRKRWPRLYGPCPKGCGFNGIAYASMAHSVAGDW